MQVKSTAECSTWSILQYFRPSLSYRLLLRSLFCLFLSGRLTQVLLYTYFIFLAQNMTASTRSRINTRTPTRTPRTQTLLLSGFTWLFFSLCVPSKCSCSGVSLVGVLNNLSLSVSNNLSSTPSTLEFVFDFVSLVASFISVILGWFVPEITRQILDCP